jgi:hypothetical protein
MSVPTAISEMSTQIISLKSRADSRRSCRILATRPFAFELRRHLGSQWLHEIKHDGFRIRVTWTSCERLPARFPDPHARNVGLSTAGDHALALRGRESGLEQVEQHVDRESMCPHHRLGATLPARAEQFEGAAAVGIGAAVVVWSSHRCATVISAPARRWIRRAETCDNALGRAARHDHLSNAPAAPEFGAIPARRGGPMISL